MVLSRWPHSLPFVATFISRSTSSAVRDSRGRRAALATRRGGGVPFTTVGGSFLFTRKPLFLIEVAYHVVPFSAKSVFPIYDDCNKAMDDPSPRRGAA